MMLTLLAQHLQIYLWNAKNSQAPSVLPGTRFGKRWL